MKLGTTLPISYLGVTSDPNTINATMIWTFPVLVPERLKRW